MVSQHNQAVRIGEWQWTKQDAFDEREDGGGGADAEGEDQDDRECIAGALDEPPGGVTEFLKKGVDEPGLATR
jgi:hypothetical protein